jgi:signal transduction histidine kinase
VSARGERASLAFRFSHPKTTVRWRLTLLYGTLFLASGAALLAITYTLVDHANVTSDGAHVFLRPFGANRALQTQTSRPGFVPVTVLPPTVRQLLRSRAGRTVVGFLGSTQRVADMHQLVVESAIALAIMTIISTALGWVVAGRVLRPLRTMTAATQQISEANLYERLAIQGPRDELRELADTIDGLLGRLQGAFEAQRRFVANASHELRTPLTAARALLELVITDPGATVETFRDACRQVLEENEQQEQLIDALLTLAHGQRGIDRRETLDLAVTAGRVIETAESDAAARGLNLEASLQPTLVSGDPRLLERLVSNLVENAIRHNVPDGRVHVRVETRAGQPMLAVTNTGPVIPADQIDRLLRPFERLTRDRIGLGEGLGLGLSIVSAIATAHGGTLDVYPGKQGGLDIAVGFPDPLEAEAPGTPELSRAGLPPVPESSHTGGE